MIASATALGLVRFRADPKLVRVSLLQTGDQWTVTVCSRLGPKAQSGKHVDPVRALAIALNRADAARMKGVDLNMSWAYDHPYGVEGAEAMYRPGWHKRDRILETHMEDPTLDPIELRNDLPSNWADWNAFARRYASRFICWAEPAPTNPSEDRYAIMKSGEHAGAHVVWERISPNPDVSAYRSSGGFYDISEEGEAIAWAKAAAADHKRQIQAIQDRSEGRCP